MTTSLPEAEFTPEAEIAPFWDGTARGVLVLPRCDACGHVIWYPRTFCPVCGSTEVSWFEASGLGSIYTFTIARRGFGPWSEAAPYVVAHVELDEGPRILTNVVGIDPDDVRIGQRVEVVFAKEGEPALYRFRPTEEVTP